MFPHSPEPQIIDSVAADHPLFGRDLRSFTDERLADAAARELLPGFTRLATHFDYSADEHQPFTNLAGSVLRRVTRTLIQHVRIGRLADQRPHNLETQDELLEAATLAFIHMAGALDALAIINGLLAGRQNYPTMGWQKSQFRDAIREQSRSAVEMFDPQTAGSLYLDAVLKFRNTIHRRMPDSATTGPANGDPAHWQAVITLSSQGHQEIFDSFEAAGWTGFVGIDRVESGFMMLRPETLVLLLLNEGIPILNAVMDATPRGRLGPARDVLAPEKSLYPPEMRAYAVNYLHLGHLLQ